MPGPDEQHPEQHPEQRPRPPARWRPPRWLKVAWVVLCLVAGVARFALATTAFDYLFGLVLVGLGLSYVRDLRQDRAGTG